ncbi:MotA/TolQ/ExbB proton channel family protein, partial [Bradyrhizobium sp.]|uniref:MotA/TolQ/ExbB proton channel family protein n=1 Tax=Bradyrhizobium sp. TaxID=376 RepID=UPI0025C41063
MAGAALAQADNPLLPRNLSPWGMFLHADMVVKAVMIGLAFASLVTWTIWLAKTIELSWATQLARRRLRTLERGPSLAEAVRACAGRRDAVAQLVLTTGREAELSGGIVDEGFKERVALRLERVEAATTRLVSRGTGILGTIGATAPFVGLFGTVWGIMNAFIGISE